MRPLNVRERRILWFCLLLGIVIGFFGCATAPAVPEVEQVGQLAAGPSVYSAPLKHDAPGEVITTETRVDAPDVQAKDGGLTVGAVR